MLFCESCTSTVLWGSLPIDMIADSENTLRLPLRFGERFRTDHYQTLTALVQSAQSCALCAALSNIVPADEDARAQFLQLYGDWAIRLEITRSQRSLLNCLAVEMWEPQLTGFSHDMTGLGGVTIGVCNRSSKFWPM